MPLTKLNLKNVMRKRSKPQEKREKIQVGSESWVLLKRERRERETDEEKELESAMCFGGGLNHL